MINKRSSPWPIVYADDVVVEKRDIVSGPFGSNIGKRFFVEDGIPVIRGNNLTLGDRRFIDSGFVFLTEEKAREFRNCQATAGDIVFTAAGTLGQVAIIPQNSRYRIYIISNKQLRLRPSPTIASSVYLYYWFSSKPIRDYIIGLNTGASVPLITLGKLRSVPISLPPLHLQQKIGSVLSAYDDLIENNLRRIKILEETGQLLYREWFVNFRFPGHGSVKNVGSPLGNMPENWAIRLLSDSIELLYGKALREQDRKEGDFQVIGSSGTVGTHNEALVTGPGIVVGRKGNVGSIHWIDGDFWPIDTVFYVSTKLPLPYVFFNLQNQGFINSDSAVPGLSRNQAYSLPFLCPQESVLNEFGKIVTEQFALISTLKAQNNRLRQARDLLLPKLVSGQLDVTDLDIKISEDRG